MRNSTPDSNAVKRLMESHSADSFLGERKERNVSGAVPAFSREDFWCKLIGCQLTTQQRSTQGSAVDRFTDTKPAPLSWESCDTHDVESFVVRTLTDFGGIRRTTTIGKEARMNRHWLNSEGGWRQVEAAFSRLLTQRSRTPIPDDKEEERRAAHLIAANLSGFGPKQSRNLWQWLGLTRYEIPLDSRVMKWVNANLSRHFDVLKLPTARYYEAALDYVQEVCQEAGVLPCMLDAAAFDYSDADAGRTATTTTAGGYVNRNGQVVIRNTGLPGTDHMQFIYQLACSRCGNVYGANGSDIHERKCPQCQSGASGLSLGTHA